MNVIPFSSTVPYNKRTILRALRVIWFAIVPLLIISLRRAVIKPIKFVISFIPIQPHPPNVVAASIPQQVDNKLVFILWFNHGQVCSQILTKSPWINPCWERRGTNNVITRFSVYNEACWTSLCSEIRWKCKLVYDTRKEFSISLFLFVCLLLLFFFVVVGFCLV